MKLYIVLNLLVTLFDVGLSQTILGFGISKDEQEIILNLHNDCRKRIANGTLHNQPRGNNLKKLKYDAALAQKAQEIANTTVMEHVAVSDARWAVGQNLYMSFSTSSGSASKWTAAIQSWFNEYTSYNYNTCCTSGTGHYTQVIWADTEYVGCGFTFFNVGTGKYPYNKLYVCNYGSAGNWVGSYPYETGDSGCEDLC